MSQSPGHAAAKSDPGARVRRRKPGPVPGQRHAGQWQPGQSGNPAGRPPKSERRRTFEELCREAVPDAVEVLQEAIHDTKHPLKDRLAAFSLLADHGYGRPVDRIAVQQIGNGGGNVRQLPKDVLEQKVTNLLARGEEIEAEFEEISEK